MKKTKLSIICCIIFNFAFAQQPKYFVFAVNGKYGITDTLGKEAVAPIYANRTVVADKKEIYLQDFSNKPDMVFDAKTGTRQLYDRIYDDKAKINGVPYAMVAHKGKYFLLSQETNTKIALNRNYEDFKTVGNYIIGSYYAIAPTPVAKKDKNGITMPAKIGEMKKYHAVLTNDENFKTVIDKGFDQYFALYKIPKKNEDEVVQVVLVDLPTKKNMSNFDYIVLSQGDNHKLYSDKMQLLKTFVLKNANEEMLMKYCEKHLNHGLTDYAPNHANDYPPMALGIGKQGNSRTTKEEFKPFFFVDKLDNGNTVFALQETKEMSKRIFEANAKFEIKLYQRQNLISVYLNGKKQGEFNYNPKTGDIYLPKTYLNDLGINLL